MKTRYFFSFCFLLPAYAAIAQCSVDAMPAYDCMGNCQGLAQVIGSTGASPFTYSWSNGDTGNSADSLCAPNMYVVTMTDNNNCVAYDTVYMIGGTYYTNQAVTNASCSTCCDGSDTMHAIPFSSSCGPLMYQWWPGDQFPTLDSVRTNLCNGSYTVTITDQCGCSGAWTSTVGVNNPTGATELSSSATTVTQAGNVVHISSTEPIEKTELFDLQGRLLFTNENAGRDLDLSLANYEASTFVVVVTSHGQRNAKIVFKE